MDTDLSQDNYDRIEEKTTKSPDGRIKKTFTCSLDDPDAMNEAMARFITMLGSRGLLKEGWEKAPPYRHRDTPITSEASELKEN